MATLPKSEILYKPNAALVMVPKIGKLTLTSRKMYNVLLYKTQRQVAVIRGAGGVVNAEHLFSARLADVIETFAAGESDPTTLAKQYLKEMRRVEVDWEAPDAREGIVWMSMGLLSEAILEKRDGSFWVFWALPPTLLKVVADPSLFTPIALDNMARLTSYTGIALYEICIRYHNNPSGLTSCNPPEWWVDALTNSPAPIDPVTGKKRRREWRKLKNASVLDAIDEINKKTDITIELIEIKTSRSVSGVQFSVHKKKSEQAQEARPVISLDVATRASEVGISVDVLGKLIQSGRTEDEIKFALIKFDERMKATDLDQVENKAAYLKSILKDIKGKVSFTDRSILKVAPLPVITEQKPWAEQRRNDLKAEFLLLLKEDQKTYADAALAEMIHKNVATSTMIRKAGEGEWSGPILSRAVELYANSAYGDTWLVEPVTKGASSPY